MKIEAHRRFRAGAVALLLLFGMGKQSPVFAEGMDHHQASEPST
jgi:hypothetical protein